MVVDRWHRVKEVFAEALETPEGPQRRKAQQQALEMLARIERNVSPTATDNAPRPRLSGLERGPANFTCGIFRSDNRCSVVRAGKASVTLSAEQAAAWSSLAAMWASDGRIHRFCNSLWIVSIWDCEVTPTRWYGKYENKARRNPF